jgi:hypothetical protein
LFARCFRVSTLFVPILVFSCSFGAQAQQVSVHPRVVKTAAPAGAAVGESPVRQGDADMFRVEPRFQLSTAWQKPDDGVVEPGSDENWMRTADQPIGTQEAHVELLPLFAKWHQGMAEHSASGSMDEAGGKQSYHWKPMLWQSVGFIGVEDSFRLMTDHYMRYLIAEGPYWRNYSISMQHWDMNRWSDGDDFEVDDIGHPMQGAVSSYIAIQNSPSWRRLRIGTSSEYWKSRMVATLWSAAFSTQQKIGPLGEAALGNAGGYTYALHCPFPCTRPNAEYTNNTGWTDFIMTPVGGTVWVIGEDFIDRFVSDKIQGDSNRLVFKIIRGSLNPTRTMANGLRGKLPWYRDYEHPDVVARGGVHVERSDADYFRHLPRYEISPHFNALSLPVNTATCTQCRKWTTGGGAEFSARLARWVDFDSDVDYQPNASPYPTNRAGGSALVGTFGFRSGIVTRHYALKASVRPGFVSYNHALLAIPASTNPNPGIGRVTHFATSLAISGDYGISRHLAFRATIGNTPIRYLNYTTPPGIGKPPNINWLSHNFYLTNENWNYQIGPVLRF